MGKEKLFFLISLILLFERLILAQGVINEIYPKLPRVDYYGINFLNPDTGFTVGREGVILKTSDGGRQWIQKPSNVTNDLIRIEAFSDYNMFICGFNGTLLRSTDIGETWDIVNLNTTTHLVGLDVVDKQSGWICGFDSLLYKTEDGGNTWIQKTTGQIGDYRDIDFFNSNIGYICGTFRFLVTTDGGQSWVSKIYGGLNTVEPVTDSIVLAGAPTGGIYYSSDRGNNWMLTNTIWTSNIRDIKFVNDTLGYAPTYGEAYYFTTDRGMSWDWGVESIGNQQITFINDTLGYGAGLDLMLTRTTDAGKTWHRLIVNENINSICFADSHNGFLCADYIFSFDRHGEIYHSTDGGITWGQLTDFPYIPDNIFVVRLIEFVNNEIGFMGSDAGLLYKTNDGGISWEVNDTTQVYVNNNMLTVVDFHFVDNYGWALLTGSDSKIKKTTDLGLSWNLMPVEFSHTLNSIYFLDEINGWVVGNSYIGKTTDGGLTWTEINTITYPKYYDVYFSDLNNGWITVNSNTTLRTTDGGISWLDAGISGYKFRIIDQDNIYLTSTDGLYYSSDRGESWNERLSSPNSIPISTIPTINNGWGIINDIAKIYKYQDTLYVPVELISFTAQLTDNSVLLNWTTATETNNKGFAIERFLVGDNSPYWKIIGFIEGNGTSTLSHSYYYTDSNVDPGNYYYRLKQIDLDGSYEYSEEVRVNLDMPDKFSLEQNYPNPANPFTNIGFTLAKDSEVILKIYDILGKEIATILNKRMSTGKYHIDFDASIYPSGVYFYALVAKSGDEQFYNSVKKMIILK